MTPPELAGYTPISEIVYPILKSLIESFWDDFKFFFLVSGDYFLGEF